MRKFDPIDQLIATHRGRISSLIPVRVARMAHDPYGFLRGAAAICASDCAAMPSTQIMPVICGDAHLGNIGFYGSAEGELVLDVNDFDEAHPGPWEWDMRRLTASIWVAGRQNHLREDQCEQAVYACMNAYRDELQLISSTPLMQRATTSVNLDHLTRTVQEPSLRHEVKKAAKKARQRTSDRALPKLTTLSDGKRIIADNPPLIIRSSTHRRDQLIDALDRYLETLPIHWRRVLGGYSVVDTAHKVVGVGSVGLRAFIALLIGSSENDVLFLQLKQAQRSVIAPHIHGRHAHHSHQGQRVVEYQQSLQTVSDPLLGWTTLSPLPSQFKRDAPSDHTSDQQGDIHVYVRQYRNMKGAVAVDDLDAAALIDYSRVVGMLMAKCHARTSGSSLIAGYIGHSDAVSMAMGHFARLYADQTEADHEALRAAIKAGKLPCAHDI